MLTICTCDFPVGAPSLVRFQFYRALHGILIDDADRAVLDDTLAHMTDKSVHLIIDAFEKCSTTYRLVAPPRLPI